MSRDQTQTPKPDELTARIIGCAIEVHRELGPGLLESIYEECLCVALTQAGMAVRRQVELPVIFRGVRLEAAYRIDLLVESRVVVEVKACERLMPVHEAQLLTYLRLAECRVGLLMNFHSALLRDAIVRRVL